MRTEGVQKVGEEAGRGSRVDHREMWALGQKGFGLKNRTFAFQLLCVSVFSLLQPKFRKEVYSHYLHFFLSLTISIYCYLHFC